MTSCPQFDTTAAAAAASTPTAAATTTTKFKSMRQKSELMTISIFPRGDDIASRNVSLSECGHEHGVTFCAIYIYL